jgi:CubicO group peptidase (beta-lactamase class C family)
MFPILVASFFTIVGAVPLEYQQPLSQTAQICEYGCDSIEVAGQELEKHIQDVMKTWHVPGVAISVVDGDKTWAKVCAKIARTILCRHNARRRNHAKDIRASATP